MKMTDGELLRRYAQERSEIAFEELVRRRINVVYSAALRQVNNDSHLAEDVTQAVFADLARKAGRLSHHPSLTAWLYTGTRFIAANVRRAEQRRAAREKEAHAMSAVDPTPESEPDWAQIRPLLDDAMRSLDAQDCQAVLLRHFERCSYSEIGSSLGLAEDAARMRVNRALEKLHDILAKRGVTSTSLALAGLLAGNAVGAAPAHLAARITNAATTGTTGANGPASLLTSKLKLALAAVALVAAIGVVIFLRSGAETSGDRAKAAGSTIATVAAVPPKNPPPVSQSHTRLHNDAVLHLQIVTADTAKPIPDVPLDYFGWAMWADPEQRKLRTHRLGDCDVIYPTNISRLELITGKEPFADTRIVWRPTLGDAIPTNCILRVERAVPIGGTVVDADGNPVAGAMVTWDLCATDPDVSKSSQSNEFYGTSYEATTDQLGRWQVNRMAGAIIPFLVGVARESNNVDSDSVFTARDKSVENQLREGTYVFKLARPVTAKGMVVDANGTPIPGATITTLVGNRSGTSQIDGSFSVPGCWPERQPITARAPGFSSTTLEVNLGKTANSIRLVLMPGKLLRLRIADKEGNPIPNANILPFGLATNQDGSKYGFTTGYLGGMLSDQEGRASLTDAPDAEIQLDVFAPGFGQVRERIRPDGQEHIITMPAAPR